MKGTKVELSARTNKAISAASLRWSGPGAGALAAAVRPDGRGLTSSFDVAESGSFWFDLVDTEGFRSQEKETARYEVRALKDEAPRVVIEEPANNRDVTPDADVPVRIVADDDFGIASVRLLYKVNGASGSEPTTQQVRPLYTAESGNAEPGKHQEVAYNWPLAPLKLSPGAKITFHADARDFDDLHGPNLGRSRDLILRVISKEDAVKQLEDRRRELREEVARTLGIQKQAMTPVEDARRTLEKADKLDNTTRDNLKNAETIQRQVTGRINGKADGLEEKVRQYLRDMKDLKVENPEVEGQVRQILAGVERIEENHLGPAEQNLTRATKTLDDQPQDGSSPDRKADAPQKGAAPQNRPDTSEEVRLKAEPLEGRAERREQG